MNTVFRRRSVYGANDQGYPVGQYHHRTKLTDAEVDEIRSLHEDFNFKMIDIAKRFNASYTTIRDICYYRRRNSTIMEWKGKKAHKSKE